MVYKYGQYKRKYPKLFRKIRRYGRKKTFVRFAKKKRTFKRRMRTNRGKSVNLTKNVARYYIDWQSQAIGLVNNYNSSIESDIYPNVTIPLNIAGAFNSSYTAVSSNVLRNQLFSAYKVVGFSYKIMVRNNFLNDQAIGDGQDLSSGMSQMLDSCMYFRITKDAMDIGTNSTTDVPYMGPYTTYAETQNDNTIENSFAKFKKIQQPKRANDLVVRKGYVSLKQWYKENALREWMYGDDDTLATWAYEVMNSSGSNPLAVVRNMPHLQIIIPINYILSRIEGVDQNMTKNFFKNINVKITTYIAWGHKRALNSYTL